jgi:uncharacterized damage-inducible protein DinB
MFRRIDDFLTEWKHETASTTRVLRALTDESLGFTAPGVRSIGRLATHIVETLTEMPGTAGLPVGEAGAAEAAAGQDAAAIADAYERDAAEVARAVRESWTDGMLADPVPMYGQEWPRGTVLSVLIKHEAHHRGQLTVLMRQAGLTVPGTYGPAREEWEAMGLPPME